MDRQRRRKNGETVIKFADLLKPVSGMSPGEEQKRAAKLFPSIVERSKLHLWKLGDTIPNAGRRLLVGIAASYSTIDLHFLDQLEAACEAGAVGSDHIDVFDIDSCESVSDLGICIPGIGQVYQTPVVGVWVDGNITHRLSGYQARQFVSDLYNLR